MLAAFEMFSYFIALIYAGIWVPEFFTTTEKRIEPWSFLTTSILSGLLTVYLAFLILGDFTKVFYTCHIIGTISALWLIYKARQKSLSPTKIPLGKVHALIGFLSLMILIAIFFTGINDWQARSAWYFQAKILHYTGSLASPDWHNPIYSFVFTAYPKLYPVVIAFVTSSWTSWNEFAPKWALIFLMLPVVTSLFSMKLQPTSILLIFLAFFGIPGSSLWNGSPDAYVAAFFALGLLNFAYYQKTAEKIHMLQSLLFMGIIPSLSPDGLAVVVCFALAISFFNPEVGALWRERNVSKFILIPLVAFIMWHMRKLEFHFTDYLVVNHDMFDRMLSRLTEIKPFLYIVRNTLYAHLDLIAFIGLIAIYFRIPQVRASVGNQIRWFRKEYSWILLAGVFHLIFLFLIYWATPFNIQWYASAHLYHAVLNIKFAVIVYVALCLEPPEEKKSARDMIEDEVTAS